MKSTIPNHSVEYMDNRISWYSMKMGKCEITGINLSAREVNFHHYIPLHLGGTVVDLGLSPAVRRVAGPT